MSIAHTWGSTLAERAQNYPCDAVLPDAEADYFRAVTINAPMTAVFR